MPGDYLKIERVSVSSLMIQNILFRYVRDSRYDRLHKLAELGLDREIKLTEKLAEAIENG